MVVVGHVWQTAGPWEQPVLGRDGYRSLSSVVPGRETHGGQAEDRDMDRHDLQSEVEYLFRGL